MPPSSRVVSLRTLVIAALVLVIFASFAAIVLLTQIMAGVLGASYGGESSSCPEQIGPYGAAQSTDDLSGVQLGHATTIVTVAQERAEPDYAIVIALAVAAQETMFLNYANDGSGELTEEQHGVDRSLSLPHDAVGNDHGSLGIMQQQYPWWGTIDELMDPATASGLFYTALHEVPGWESMTVNEAAQTVQRSAYPDAYGRWEQLARELLAQVSGNDPGDVLCGPGDAMTCPPTGLPVEAGLTPDALRVLRCVQLHFGEHTYHGVGERPNASDHPEGRAVDVMIDNWTTPEGNTHGWEIAEWLRAHVSQLGVKYVIFDAKIWSDERNAEGWRDYEHPSGSTDPNSLHRNHVHVSAYGDSAGGGTTDGEWLVPVAPGSYQLTSGYGPRPDPTGPGTDFHTGLDFAAPAGTWVIAASVGTVTHAGPMGNYGNLVVVQSGNVAHYYAHLGTIAVDDGQQVPAGQIVGTVGATGRSTGPHLHFEIRVGGATTDPLSFLRRHGADPGELP